MSDRHENAAVVAAISAILKENWIIDTIQKQYSTDRPLLALLEKSSKDVDGGDTVLTMRLGPNVSTGARGEMADLPKAGRQTTKKVRIPLAYWYTVCAFSGQAIKKSKGPNSLARVITDELTNAVEDHKKVENAYLYLDGSGALATVESYDTGTKTVVVSGWSSLFQVDRELETNSAKDGSGSGMDANSIVAVDRENRTITFDNALTSIGNSHYVFLNGTVNNASMGLMGICDDGTFVPTFQELDRSVYPQAKARVFSSSTPRTISEDILLDVIARLREDGASPDLVIGTSFQLNDICKDLKERVRFIDPKTGIDLGVSGIKIGDGKAMFTHDSDCPPGYCFPLAKKKIIISELDKLGFMDQDGNVLARIAGKDGYEATLTHYFNLVALSCFDQARVEMLNENRVGD